jgi:putative endonuclease
LLSCAPSPEVERGNYACQVSSFFGSGLDLFKLVYYESFDSITEAIKREKYMKGKGRKWKIELTNAVNPDWIDLTEEIMKFHS